MCVFDTALQCMTYCNKVKACYTEHLYIKTLVSVWFKAYSHRS